MNRTEGGIWPHSSIWSRWLLCDIKMMIIVSGALAVTDCYRCFGAADSNQNCLTRTSITYAIILAVIIVYLSTSQSPWKVALQAGGINREPI